MLTRRNRVFCHPIIRTSKYYVSKALNLYTFADLRSRRHNPCTRAAVKEQSLDRGRCRWTSAWPRTYRPGNLLLPTP
jgi:hypothetical protein